MEAHKGNRSIPPFIPNLSTRRRRMVNIVSQPLYPQKKLQCPLNRRLGGLDGFEDDKISCPYQHSKPRLSGPELATILTTLTLLVWFKYKNKKRDGFISLWLGMLHCSNSMINTKFHKPTSDESSLIVCKPKVTSLFYIKQNQLP